MIGLRWVDALASTVDHGAFKRPGSLRSENKQIRGECVGTWHRAITLKVGHAGGDQHILVDAMPAGEFAAVAGQNCVGGIGNDLRRAAAADGLLAAEQVAYRRGSDDRSGP